MSLYSDMLEPCLRLLPETGEPDSQGGGAIAWTEGERFSALIVKNAAREVERGERRDVVETYTVSVDAGRPLRYNEVFRRLSDGATFRVTSNGADCAAPAAASVQIARATAERWVLPE